MPPGTLSCKHCFPNIAFLHEEQVNPYAYYQRGHSDTTFFCFLEGQINTAVLSRQKLGQTMTFPTPRVRVLTAPAVSTAAHGLSHQFLAGIVYS